MKHMTYTDRLILEKLLNEKIEKSVIADTLGVHISTIYREIRRGLTERLNYDYTVSMVYTADAAQRDYDYRASAKGAPLKIGNNHLLTHCIERLVIDGKYSPYAVLSLLRNIGISVPIGVSTLYSYIMSTE